MSETEQFIERIKTASPDELWHICIEQRRDWSRTLLALGRYELAEAFDARTDTLVDLRESLKRHT